MSKNGNFDTIATVQSSVFHWRGSYSVGGALGLVASIFFLRRLEQALSYIDNACLNQPFNLAFLLPPYEEYAVIFMPAVLRVLLRHQELSQLLWQYLRMT